MRHTSQGSGLSRDAEAHYNNPLVRRGVDVQELNVSKGDIIFLCTDGYNPERPGRGFNLSKAFQGKSVGQGLNTIMAEVIENRRDYLDNIAISAMRVE